jgi:hypothetical protein
MGKGRIDDPALFQWRSPDGAQRNPGYDLSVIASEAKQSISRRGFNRLHHQEALLQLLDVRVESVMRSKADVR